MWWEKWHWLIDWLWKWIPAFNKSKNQSTFPGVTPDKNSWDEIYKQQLISNPLANYPASSSNVNINPTYNNHINANGLSASELEAVLNKTNKDNTEYLKHIYADSKNKK